MPFRELHDYVNLLENRIQLAHINTPVSPKLEITEITDRVSKGPREKNLALLFENIPGYDIPVLINAFGSPERMAWALGVENLEQLNQELASVIDLRLPQGLGEVMGRGKDLLKVLRSVGLRPKKVRQAPVQEVIVRENPSLDFLPILQCWPQDGGRFITLPQVITRDPQSQTRNVGMYRLQVVDHERPCWCTGSVTKAAPSMSVWRVRLQKDLIPAAIVLGGDPASMWCASAPLPPNIDEYLLAGYLRGAPIEFVDCVTQPLEVPANAEIVIEGYVDPERAPPRRTFWRPYRLLHAGRALPGLSRHSHHPPQESDLPYHHRGYPADGRCVDGQSHRAAFPAPDPAVLAGDHRHQHACRRRVSQPGGCIHQETLPGSCAQSDFWACGVWRCSRSRKPLLSWMIGWMCTTFLRLPGRRWGMLIGRTMPSSTKGPVDHLDHASYQHSFGGKIGIDATAKLAEEGYTRTWPDVVRMDPEIRRRVDEIWPLLGL